MPASPVSTQQGVRAAFGGGDESLARRKAAAAMVANNAQEKSEGLGALIAGVAPALLSTAGSVVGNIVAPGVGGQVGSAIGGGIGEAIGGLDTSEQELQAARQEEENIKAEEEGRAPKKIGMQQSSTKQTAGMIGKLGSSLGGDLLGSINLGG